MKTKNLISSPDQAFDVLTVPGNLLIYPTDTVWGIGCIITNEKALDNLFLAKKRQAKKPVSILVSDINMAKQYACINAEIEAELKKHWPGKTTFVIKTKNLNTKIHGDTGLIGIRCIDHPFVSRLLELCQTPITTTSANVSGDSPVKNGKELLSEMPEYVHCVNDDSILDGPPSRVIKLDGKIKTVLR